MTFKDYAYPKAKKELKRQLLVSRDETSLLKVSFVFRPLVQIVDMVN